MNLIFLKIKIKMKISFNCYLIIKIILLQIMIVINQKKIFNYYFLI